MEMFETAIVVVHVLVSIALVALVLLQQGKGAEAGASLGGGASQTVFGSAGSGNFLSRSTAILAFVFFITSIGLAVIAKQKAEIAPDQDVLNVPAVEAQVEASEGDDALDQSFDDIKASLGGDIDKADAGFQVSDDAPVSVDDEFSTETLPEIE